ncbi:MAG: radical SAM protein [Candidatus Thorarchaeota archaeon]
MEREELLRLKIRLLTEGVRLPEGISTGRKGGAGPVGARYFLLPDGSTIGIPIRGGRVAETFNSANLEQTETKGMWLYDSKYLLTEVPRPAFYDMRTEDSIEFSKLALLHGSDCLATTVLQECKYWGSGEQCKFCTIPTSYLAGSTTKEKTPSQIAQIVAQAESDGIIKHILLTTGTSEEPDMGVGRMVNIVSEIRKLSNLPIAVQFEPPDDLTQIDSLAKAGVNAVGIHIESADEEIRMRVCPGKYDHASREDYIAAWDYARRFFAKGDVSTFLLYGLGEDEEKTLEFCDFIASKGVFPIVTPVRPALGSQLAEYIPSYVGNLDHVVEFYKRLGKILVKHELDPRATAGSCSRCGGCTPIQEAYNWASQEI